MSLAMSTSVLTTSVLVSITHSSAMITTYFENQHCGTLCSLTMLIYWSCQYHIINSLLLISNNYNKKCSTQYTTLSYILHLQSLKFESILLIIILMKICNTQPDLVCVTFDNEQACDIILIFIIL